MGDAGIACRKGKVAKETDGEAREQDSAVSGSPRVGSTENVHQ